MRLAVNSRKRVRLAGSVAAAGILIAGLLGGSASASANTANGVSITSAGVKPGQIKHVWLIILENKSYDATFTGLNQNSYLWKTLPSQGVLLKNYYGTGHDSLDNYLSMTSGQAPLTDTQDDCPDYDAIPGSVASSGNLDSNPNYGQLVSAAGANAAAGQNGCVY